MARGNIFDKVDDELEEVAIDSENGERIVNPYIVIRPEGHKGNGIRVNVSSFRRGHKYLIGLFDDVGRLGMSKETRASLYGVVVMISKEGGLPEGGAEMWSETNLGYITEENLKKALPVTCCGQIELMDEGIRALEETKDVEITD